MKTHHSTTTLPDSQHDSQAEKLLISMLRRMKFIPGTVW